MVKTAMQKKINNENSKTYVVDIDGVICNEDCDVIYREPNKKRIEQLNKLYDNGNIIYYLTARGMTSQNNNQALSDKKYRKITETQLKKWGCKFDEVYFGKPNADYYIDNKNVLMEEFFDV